jgi:hypothetical protein
MKPAKSQRKPRAKTSVISKLREELASERIAIIAAHAVLDDLGVDRMLVLSERIRELARRDREYEARLQDRIVQLTKIAEADADDHDIKTVIWNTIPAHPRPWWKFWGRR